MAEESLPKKINRLNDRINAVDETFKNFKSTVKSTRLLLLIFVFVPAVLFIFNEHSWYPYILMAVSTVYFVTIYSRIKKIRNTEKEVKLTFNDASQLADEIADQTDWTNFRKRNTDDNTKTNAYVAIKTLYYLAEQKNFPINGKKSYHKLLIRTSLMSIIVTTEFLTVWILELVRLLRVIAE